MNQPDPFEEELRQQNFQSPPLGWKREILAEAMRHLPAAKIGARSRPWQEWLFPYRYAYAGFAAAWVAILFFHATAPTDPVSEQIARSIYNSPQKVEWLLARWEQNQFHQNLGL